MNQPANSLRMRVAVGLAGLCVGGAPLQAGEFTVDPIRLELGAAARSGVITVRNEGKEKLGFQLQASEWSQDALGKDQYSETRDLIFFPKIMSVDPGEVGVVRVGTRAAVVQTEKTYRLFIEELPGAAKEAQAPGATLNVLIRFGAPIFVTPLNPSDSAAIASLELARGVLTLSVKNTGNRHQVIQGIQLAGVDAQGKEVYAMTLADRYLLAGANKSYTATIPADQCAKITGLSVELKTDKVGVKRKLDVSRAMCS